MRLPDFQNDTWALAAAERLQDIVDEPLWTEYFEFYCFDKKSGIGTNVHIGRESYDMSLWRATVSTFLPNDELLVAKVFGRQVGQWTLTLGALTVSCVVPGQLWSLTYCGSAQRVTRQRNAAEAHRDGIDEPLEFNVAMQGAAPLWDLRSSIGDANSYSRMHTQQVCRATGIVTAAGHTNWIDGAGMRDHSSGARDYSKVEGDFWLSALFPDGRALMAQIVELTDSITNTGYVYWGDRTGLETISVVEAPVVPNRRMPARSVPHDLLAQESTRVFSTTIKTARGLARINARALHAASTMFIAPSFEAFGTDPARIDELQWTLAAVEVEWDGQIGTGVRERISPIRVLDLP